MLIFHIRNFPLPIYLLLKDEDDSDEAFEDDYFILPDPTDLLPIDPLIHMLIGGYGPAGPIPEIGIMRPTPLMNHLPLSPQPFPSEVPLIPPIPPEFPLGYFGTYSTIYNNQLLTCSPGVTIQKTLRSVHSRRYYKQHVFHPGVCHHYNPFSQLWSPFSGPMNSFRPGASLVRMGKFIVASGGNRRTRSMNSIEVLNIDNPKRWKTLSKITLPNPTHDHCTVAINKTALFISGGFGQESQAMILDLKGKQYYLEEPLIHPRRQVRQ